MTATNNLSRTLLTETQSQKATGANTQVGEVDAALTATITVELLVGDTAYPIDSADLKRCSLMIFDEAGATPIAANFTATWTPFDRGLVSFYNATAFIATLNAASGTTETIKLPPGGFVTFRIGATRSVIVGQPSTSYIKQPCRAATTAPITIATALNAGDTIDGVTLAAGDRVLVKDQSTASENGIYIAGASPARAADWDEAGDVLSGVVVAVTEGSANADAMFMLTTDAFPITPGTTNIAFAEFGGGGGGGGPATGYPAPVRVATTANITIATALNAGDTIDGVTLSAGDRVLVKNQSTASENGIYVVDPSPARATDFDSNTTEVVGGAIVFVLDGTVNQGKQFVLSTTGAITVGSTNLTFTELATYNPPFSLGYFFSGTPDVSITMAESIFTFAVDMPDDFAGSYGRVGTNPSGTTVLDIQKNGSSIGSASISSGGAFTFSTTGGATSFAAGDRISIVTPVNLNGLSNVTLAFAGTRSL
jgi:hypothetical protein